MEIVTRPRQDFTRRRPPLLPRRSQAMRPATTMTRRPPREPLHVPRRVPPLPGAYPAPVRPSTTSTTTRGRGSITAIVARQQAVADAMRRLKRSGDAVFPMGARSKTAPPKRRLSFRDAAFKVWAEVIRNRRDAGDEGCSKGDEDDSRKGDDLESDSRHLESAGNMCGRQEEADTSSQSRVEEKGVRERQREDMDEHGSPRGHQLECNGEGKATVSPRKEEEKGQGCSNVEKETPTPRGARGGNRLSSIVGLLLHRQVTNQLESTDDDAASEWSDVITASEARSLLKRPSARLSPEAQYAMLKGYEDKILQEITKTIPRSKALSAMRPKTPRTPVCLNATQSEGNDKMVRVKVVRNVRSAIQLLDTLRTPEPLPSPTTGLKHPHVTKVRRWCQRWTRDFSVETQTITELKC